MLNRNWMANLISDRIFEREKSESKKNRKSISVLHPTKEGQFPLDPIFFGQTPVFLEGPWSGDSETVGGIEKGV